MPNISSITINICIGNFLQDLYQELADRAAERWASIPSGNLYLWEELARNLLRMQRLEKTLIMAIDKDLEINVTSLKAVVPSLERCDINVRRGLDDASPAYTYQYRANALEEPHKRWYNPFSLR